MRLHPHNIAQKTEVMVEHFQAVTRHKIGGRAKAMVVTGSRLEAVRYKQSFDRYIKEKGYPIKSLVAFSGTVQDDKAPGRHLHRRGMNRGIKREGAAREVRHAGIPSSARGGEVPDRLRPAAAAHDVRGQAARGHPGRADASRLNRTHPLKEDTFVLDFVNDREEIREAFKTYYEGAEMGEEVDPARMYQIKGELDASGIYLDEEVERFCDVYFKPKQRQSAVDHQAMNAALDPAVSRFTARQKDERGRGGTVARQAAGFRNLYGFLSQVIPYQDSDLEQLYVFLRHLAAKLPRRESGPAYQFDDDVRLSTTACRKSAKARSLCSEGEAGRLDGPKEVGSGVVREQPVPLSQLIDILNERFGTDFNQADQLFFDQIVEAAIADEAEAGGGGESGRQVRVGIQESARDPVRRAHGPERGNLRSLHERCRFQKLVTGWLSSEAYKRLREEVRS